MYLIIFFYCSRRM